MSWQEHISVDPLIMHGKACIRGTRIPVAVVLANLADGLSPDEILHSYPSLSRKAIQAALAYAAELAEERVLELLAGTATRCGSPIDSGTEDGMG